MNINENIEYHTEQNLIQPWQLYELVLEESDHACDICDKNINIWDFRCNECEDFDICIDCKLNLETDLNKQNKVKNEMNHLMEHILSQQYMGYFTLADFW